jgi:tetratricopeptide (TPR) repeat protein
MSDRTELELQTTRLQQQAETHLATGQLEQAIATCQQMLRLKPNCLAAFKIAADALVAQGKLEIALKSYLKAIEIDPNLADAHANIAVLLHQQDRFEAALPYYQRALQLNPDRAETYYNLGIGLSRQGRLDEALACYQRVIQLQPERSVAYYICGTIFHQQNKLSEAANCYRKAISLEPDYAEPYCNLGVLMARQGSLTEAIACYEKAIAINPKFAEAHTNLGAAYIAQGKSVEAINSYQQAIAIKPGDAISYSNLGNAYFEQGMLSEAIAACQNALLVNPHCAEAYSNLGNALLHQNLVSEAIDNYEKAIEYDPSLAPAHYSLSHALMLLGNYQRGWDEYEWRWRMQKISLPSVCANKPLWDGSELEGRRILLLAEQGFGDTLQFIRYVNLVIQHGGHVILSCPPALHRLLSTIEGIAQVITDNLDAIEFDVYAPLLSLPRIFSTDLATIPAQVPYLFDNIQDVESGNLPQNENCDRAIKVGIVWASGYRDRPDTIRAYRQKSCPLPLFKQIFAIPHLNFYSLQIGRDATDLNAVMQDSLYQRRIYDCSSQITDFYDTATIISQVDLVISIDTAVIHLAGAMAKPVWVLLPFTPDWRWLLQREDSPWYPTMRLFRQDRPNDWDNVLHQIYNSLQSFHPRATQ